MEEKKEGINKNLKKIFGLENKADKSNDENKKTLIKNIGPTNFVIILMVGILLLILSLPSGKKDEKTSKAINDKQEVNNMESSKISIDKNQTEIYIELLEDRLEEVLKKVDGIGDVEVMITLKGSKELIILKDKPYSREQSTESDGEGGERNTSSEDYQENTIMIEDEEGRTIPYVIKELEPQVEGILVISTGGDNSEIINQIIETSQVLFGVPAHKVKVMKMN